MTALMVSKGNSSAASYVDQKRISTTQYFSHTVTFGKQPAYTELLNLWKECKQSDWDGYKALPVQEETLNNALVFIYALPLGFPLPSFGVEPDGHITMEWYCHPRWLLSVSISPDKKLYYAALFDNDIIKGNENFYGDISRTITTLIERVKSQKNS